jgi:hypothetical protein
MPNPIDVYSDTWREIESRVKSRIENQRNILESHMLDAIQTEYARGRIAAYREILKFPAAKPSNDG